MSLFTEKIDRDKNWIIKYGTSFILIIILVIAFALVTFEVPVYDELTLIRHSQKNTYTTTINQNSHYNYTLNGTINMFVNNNTHVRFIIHHIDNDTKEVVLKTKTNLNNIALINAKIFIKDESLINMVLQMKL